MGREFFTYEALLETNTFGECLQVLDSGNRTLFCDSLVMFSRMFILGI